MTGRAEPPYRPERRYRPAPVAVDTMGGDHGPDEIVTGAVAAVREHGARLVLVGQAPRIRARLDRLGMAGQIPIVHADEALSMDEGALASWRKPRSSVAIACHLIKQGRASALVSAGTTAGVVATARLRLKGQQGVMRPAIAVTLPTRPRPTVLLDAGATADVKPETLVQFAAFGTAYAQVRLGLARPRVGLLNIGAEPGKGDKVTKRAYELLTGGQPGIEFAGNVEGDGLLTGAVDVIVTDGFTGNVALKTLEGAMRMASAEVRSAVTATRTARVGALLQRRRLLGLRERFDSETYGGGVLLGLNGTVIIAHGASHARAIASACALAHDLAAGRIVDKVRELVATTRTSRFGRWTHGDRDDKDRPAETSPAEPSPSGEGGGEAAGQAPDEENPPPATELAAGEHAEPAPSAEPATPATPAELVAERQEPPAGT